MTNNASRRIKQVGLGAWAVALTVVLAYGTYDMGLTYGWESWLIVASTIVAVVAGAGATGTMALLTYQISES